MKFSYSGKVNLCIYQLVLKSIIIFTMSEQVELFFFSGKQKENKHQIVNLFRHMCIKRQTTTTYLYRVSQNEC